MSANDGVVYVLEPDVLDQQDVLTMSEYDPGWQTLQRQLFTLTFNPKTAQGPAGPAGAVL